MTEKLKLFLNWWDTGVAWKLCDITVDYVISLECSFKTNIGMDELIVS